VCARAFLFLLHLSSFSSSSFGFVSYERVEGGAAAAAASSSSSGSSSKESEKDIMEEKKASVK